MPPTYLEHWSWDSGPNKSGGTLARSSVSSYLTASHVLYKICKPASIANTDVIPDICIVKSLTMKMSGTSDRLQPLQIYNSIGAFTSNIDATTGNALTKQSGLRSGAKHRAQDALSYSDEVQKHLKRYVKRLGAAFGRTRNLRHAVTSK